MQLFEATVVYKLLNSTDEKHPTKRWVIMAEDRSEAEAEAEIQVSADRDHILAYHILDLGLRRHTTFAHFEEHALGLRIARETGKGRWTFIARDHVEMQPVPLPEGLFAPRAILGMRPGLARPDCVRGVEVAYSDAYMDLFAPLRDGLPKRRGIITSVQYPPLGAAPVEDGGPGVLVGVAWKTGVMDVVENMTPEHLTRVG